MNQFVQIPGSSQSSTLTHRTRISYMAGFLLAGIPLFVAVRNLTAQQAEPLSGTTLPTAPATPAVAASVAPAPTALETKAYDFLKAASYNYQDMKVDQVAELFTVGSIGGPQAAAALIVQYGGFPDVEQFPDGSFGPLTVGIVPGYPDISPAKIASVEAAIASMLDNADTLVWADWTGTEIGPFNTVIALNLTEVKFDTLVSSMPGTWPPTPGSNGFYGSSLPPAQTPETSAELNITNLFGCMALVKAEVKVQCLNGKVVTCTSESSIDTEPLWEGRVSPPDCKTITNPDGSGTECCYCEVSLGAASGFKSLEVEVGGFKLKVTGSLGCGFTKNVPIQKCCNQSEE